MTVSQQITLSRMCLYSSCLHSVVGHQGVKAIQYCTTHITSKGLYFDKCLSINVEATRGNLELSMPMLNHQQYILHYQALSLRRCIISF